MIRRAILLACLLAPLSAYAQVPAAPALTVEEQKDRDILSLKAQLTSALRTIADLQAAVGACQAQLGPYQSQQNGQALDAEKKALQDRVERRTGYAWDPETGTFGAKKPMPAPVPPKPGGQ